MDSLGALRPQKIMMLIKVIPRPRLDVVRESRKTAEVGRSVDDGLRNEAAYDSAGDIEVNASSLAFDVSTENLFLLDGESVESLLSGSQKTVTAILRNSPANSVSDGDCDAKQQNHAKIRLTFIPQFEKANLADDGIRREKYNRGNHTQRNAIPQRLLEKFKKWFHEASKGHRSLPETSSGACSKKSNVPRSACSSRAL